MSPLVRALTTLHLFGFISDRPDWFDPHHLDGSPGWFFSTPIAGPTPRESHYHNFRPDFIAYPRSLRSYN